MPLHVYLQVIDAGVFATNYFTVSQLVYFYGGVWECITNMINSNLEV